MLKTLVLGASLVLTLGACATVSPTSEVARAVSLARVPERVCVPDTATRIPVKGDECAAFGQSYTGDEIQSTGQRDLGQALLQLDPALTVRRR